MREVIMKDLILYLIMVTERDCDTQTDIKAAWAKE